MNGQITMSPPEHGLIRRFSLIWGFLGLFTDHPGAVSSEPQWAYAAPRQVPPPRFEQDVWSDGVIDAFVSDRVRQAEATSSDPAVRIRLMRRLHIDLLGLPPGWVQVQAFSDSRAPDAWERVVERLLASPHYGERMAIHWLDLCSMPIRPATTVIRSFRSDHIVTM